jgi:hypothetical protein
VPQADHVSALPVADPEVLDEDLRELFALCTEKLGLATVAALNRSRVGVSAPATMR